MRSAHPRSAGAELLFVLAPRARKATLSSWCGCSVTYDKTLLVALPLELAVRLAVAQLPGQRGVVFQSPRLGSSSSLSANCRIRAVQSSALAARQPMAWQACRPRRDCNINVSWTIQGAYDKFPGLWLQQLSPLVEDKANLGATLPGQLLGSRIASAHAVSRDSKFLCRPLAQSIIRCGRQSLQIFCLGILLSVSGHIVLTSIRGDVSMQLVLLMIAIAQLLTWSKASGGRQAGAPLAAWTTFLAGGRNLEGSKRHVTRLFCFLALGTPMGLASQEKHPAEIVELNGFCTVDCRAAGASRCRVGAVIGQLPAFPTVARTFRMSLQTSYFQSVAHRFIKSARCQLDRPTHRGTLMNCGVGIAHGRRAGADSRRFAAKITCSSRRARGRTRWQ
jgi:OpgC protein